MKQFLVLAEKLFFLGSTSVDISRSPEKGELFIIKSNKRKDIKNG